MRRPKGSGTIEKTREGKYRARFSFKPGTREDIDGSPFDTRKQAEVALDALMAALAEEGASRGGITLRKLGEKALAQRDRDGYRSVDGEYDLWNARVETWERCSMPASSTTRGDVKAWLSSMRSLRTGKPLATQTRKNALNLLRAVYAFGVDHELVPENPCLGIKVKDHGRTSETSTYLSAKEVETLIGVATDPGVALAIGTGMRSGELRTLHWEDVHDDSITVRYGGLKDGNLAPPKNGKIRVIPILPIAANALAQLRVPFGDTAPSGLVLPTVTGCVRKKGHVFDRVAWKSWLSAAKFTRRVRPHDLRHTTATLLLSGAWGEPWSYEAVKEMLGHSSVKVTERYARATGTLAQKAAAKLIASIDKPATSPQMSDAERVQAREILERRGSDSNRRMTVLQTQRPAEESRPNVDVAGLARAYVEAVANGESTAIAKGLALADQVWATAAKPLRRPA